MRLKFIWPISKTLTSWDLRPSILNGVMYTCEEILYDRRDAAKKVLYLRVVTFLERKTFYKTDKKGKRKIGNLCYYGEALLFKLRMMRGITKVSKLTDLYPLKPS